MESSAAWMGSPASLRPGITNTALIAMATVTFGSRRPRAGSVENRLANLRTLANGQHCRLRIPGLCHDRNVVLCHIKRGHCGSIKPADIVAVYGCGACHDEIDGRTHASGLTRVELDSLILRALCQQLEAYAKEEIVTW